MFEPEKPWRRRVWFINAALVGFLLGMVSTWWQMELKQVYQDYKALGDKACLEICKLEEAPDGP